MSRKTACLFPAFAMRYKDPRGECLDGFQDEVARFQAEAATVVEINARKFEEPGHFVLDDELENNLQEQYVCYINSCAVGSLLRRRMQVGGCVLVRPSRCHWGDWVFCWRVAGAGRIMPT